MAGSEVEVKGVRMFKVIFCCRNIVTKVVQNGEEVRVQVCNH